jgi:plastocyanin
MTRFLFAAALLAASTAAASAQTVNVQLSEWKVRPSRDTVRAGRVTLQVSNTGSMSHSLWVLGDGVDKGTQTIATKQIASLTVVLKPGTYELFCPMSEESHKKAGMTKMLVVLPADTLNVPKKPDN